MSKKLKIAIYSGDIPSTTFIERLIKGLSVNQQEIYLFGFLKNKVSYTKNTIVVAYKNTKISKALHLLKYSILLFFFKNKEKKRLDSILSSQSKNVLLSKVKYYPVLWHKPDIFHVQWAKGLADWIWVKEFGIKLVLSLRGAHINYSPIADLELAKMYKKYFPKVDGFHAVSKAIALETEKYSAKKEKTKVVYSGLNIEVNKADITKKSTIFHIISVGRSHWIKGYVYALDACRLLKEKGFQFKYTIIGGAKDIELLYQIEDLGLQDEVTLLDNMSFSKVQQQIQNSDLLLLSSLKEGIANVVLEAMLLKTLVLTTDCGGMEEVIKDDENGFLIPIRNSELMANKIFEIGKIPESDKEQITKNAINTVQNQHNEEQMINGMLELYHNM